MYDLINNSAKYKIYTAINLFSKSKDGMRKMEIVINSSGSKIVQFYWMC